MTTRLRQHGLDTGTVNTALDTPCARDPERWWRPPGATDPQWRHQAGTAIHQCLTHCPALQRCQETAYQVADRGSVLAGVEWTRPKRAYAAPDRTLPAVNQPVPVPCPACAARRQALLDRLRQAAA